MTEELQALIQKHVETFEAWPAPGSDCSERGTLIFSFSFGDLRGEWRCGSAVPLHAYLKKPFKVKRLDGLTTHHQANCIRAAKAYKPSLHDQPIRYAIRQAYRPEPIDVMASLLLEAAGAEHYTDWLDWAEEFGGLADATPTSLRELQSGFALIKQRIPQLRRLFGTDYDKACELAGQM